MNTTQFHSVSAAADAQALAMIEGDYAVLYNRTTGSVFFDINYFVLGGNDPSFLFARITAGLDLQNTDVLIN